MPLRSPFRRQIPLRDMCIISFNNETTLLQSSALVLKPILNQGQEALRLAGRRGCHFELTFAADLPAASRH